MTVAVVTPMWQRYKLVALAQKQLALAIGDRDIERWIVGSEGAVSATLAAEAGARYLEFPNKPLGAKQNAIVKHVIKRKEISGIILIGSDNLLTETSINDYLTGAGAGADIVGYLDGYRYLARAEMLTYWPGYHNHRTGETTGCRYYSRRIIEGTHRELWNPELNRCLDGSATAQTRLVKPPPKITTLKQGSVVKLAGVESAVTISRTTLTMGRVQVPLERFYAAFGDLIDELIMLMRSV